MSAILVKVSRGEYPESLHRGSIAVVDNRGTLLDSAGDPDFLTFLRSCAKPFQALPVLESGAADHFQFTAAELACMCGSLNGQEYQVEAVSGILSKIGLSENDLQCGIHPPLHRPTAREMEEEGKKPRPLHHNCAGKHAGMLAVCVYYGWPTQTYSKVEHPVQQTILNTVSRMTEVPREGVKIGTDGCGVPTFAVPLKNLALAYAKLAVDLYPGGATLSDPHLLRLMKAAVEHPEMIAGDERICTDLMRAAPGRVFAKNGSEASYGLSLMGKSIGIALKIEDGNPRASGPAVIEVLRQYGILQGESLDRLRPYGPKLPVLNFRKEAVGEIEAVFRMPIRNNAG